MTLSHSNNLLAAGDMKIRTTSLECVIEDLVDGTEYIVTVVPSYDLEWEDVQDCKFSFEAFLKEATSM